jgi:PAS domain S-box-containing protein
VITEVNSAACRLFGYSRLQMERRSIFSFLPPVLDRVHELSLKSYAKSGEAEMGVVDYTRVSLVSTKSGVLLPVLSSFKDAQGTEDAAQYIWALRELRTDTNYVLLSPYGAILGVSGGSQVLLGVDPATLASSNSNNGGVGVPPIPTFFQDWDAPGKQEALRRATGTSLTLYSTTTTVTTGTTGTTLMADSATGGGGAFPLSPGGGGVEGVRRGSTLRQGAGSGGEDEWAEAFGIASTKSPGASSAAAASRRASTPTAAAAGGGGAVAGGDGPPPPDPAAC